jgi:hypothetical protein
MYIKSDGGNMSDNESAYNLLPNYSRAGPIRIITEWFKELTDPKVTADLILLIIKSFPIVVAIFTPILILILAWFFDSIVTNYKENPTLFFIVISAVSTALAMFSINQLSNNKFAKKLRNLDVHNDFKIIQYAVCAKIISETEIIYVFRFIVRSRKNHQTQFPIIFNWTGDGAIEVKLRNNRYSLSKSYKSVGNFSKSILTFDREINKNEEIKIEYQIHTISKDVSESPPYIGISAFCDKYPRFNTHLIAVFPESSIPISLHREYYHGSYSLGAYDAVTINLDVDGIHRWPVHAVTGRCYCIRWDFGA